jgi:hypothetical protein
MKKLALINSYCNNWDKISVLYKNIQKLKELKIDSLVYSPIALPKEITEIADYTIISKENPIIYWPEKGMIHWSNHSKFQTRITVPDYGWASFYQYKKLMEYGSTLDYDHYYWVLYDIILEDEIINELQNSHPNLFFPHSKSKISRVGAIFASLSKKNIIKLIPFFTKEIYLEKSKDQIAEMFLEYVSTCIEGEHSKYLVKDLIDEHGNLSFNVVDERYPFKVALDNTQYKFALYDLPSYDIIVTVVINGLFYDFKVTQENPIIQLNLDINNLKSVLFFYKDIKTNLTNYYPPYTNIIRSI